MKRTMKLRAQGESWQVTTYEKVQAEKVIFPGQPIQWHLPQTNYDCCPRCGASLGFLGRARRACMGRTGPRDEHLENDGDAYYRKHGTCPPGTVWETPLTPRGFVLEMIKRGEPARRPRPGRPRKEE